MGRQRLGFFLRVSWAMCLGALCVQLAVQAISPLARTWRLANTSQSGELAVYNTKFRAGYFGHPVEMGDYNGDGHVDLVMGPMAASAGPILEPGSQRPRAGEVYVYPGTGGPIEGFIDRSGDTPPGLTLWGARAGDMLGTELYTADLNGDGIDDLIASAQNYDGLGDPCIRTNSGGVFVVFGRRDPAPGEGDGLLADGQVLDTATFGTGGAPPGILTVLGPNPGARLGIWVEAGDLDGDGFSDLLVGADQTAADPDDPNQRHSGMVAVIYGRADFPEVIDLAVETAAAPGEGLPGLSFVYGREREDHFGSTLHSLDLDGDGRAELIAAAALNRLSASEPGFDCNGGQVNSPCFPEITPLCAHYEGGGDGPAGNRPNAGEVDVIFAPAGGGRLPRVLDLAQPLPPEFEGRITLIHGRRGGDLAGEEITSGDFNGDGHPDLALGALTAAGPTGILGAGMTHVIYWRPGLEGKTIDLNPDVAGGLPPGVHVSNMFGINSWEIFGDTLSAGDFNHDGFDDLAIGVPHFTPTGAERAGAVAVVLGGTEPWPALWTPEADELPPGLSVAYLLGAEAYDLTSYSMEARDYDNDGYADIFPNAMWGDGRMNQSDAAGEAYLVSGYLLVEATLGVDRVDPPQGSGVKQTTVEVIGSGFTTSADTRVFIGDMPAISVQVLTCERLLAEVAPPATRLLEPVDVRVVTRYGDAVLTDGFTFTYPEAFVRGDPNLDLIINITDPIFLLSSLFFSKEGLECRDAADANDDGSLDVSDALRMLNYLFLNGPPPAAPFPEAGFDTTIDDLGCR